MQKKGNKKVFSKRSAKHAFELALITSGRYLVAELFCGFATKCS